VFALGAVSWLAMSPETHQPIQAEAVQESSSDAAFEAAADYAMLDNYDIYACLSDE